MSAPLVEFFYSIDCPSHLAALEQLRRLMRKHKLDPVTMCQRLILNQQEAEQEGFTGSPTIRINGVDVSSPGDALPSTACRVYVHGNGRFDPLPEDETIDRALRQAAN